MIVTDEFLKLAQTKNHGYTGPQLKLLGVAWPPPFGWQDELIGTELAADVALRFALLPGVADVADLARKLAKHVREGGEGREGLTAAECVAALVDLEEAVRFARSTVEVYEHAIGKDALSEAAKANSETYAVERAAAAERVRAEWRRLRSERRYIRVPYGEKDMARALGAEWDPQAKSWYVPPGRDIDRFRMWATPDTKDAGTVWWESLSQSARSCWLKAADTELPTLAWEFYQQDRKYWCDVCGAERYAAPIGTTQPADRYRRCVTCDRQMSPLGALDVEPATVREPAVVRKRKGGKRGSFDLSKF